MRIERFTWGPEHALIFHDDVRDFDPEQPRDPHGRWTFAGGPMGQRWHDAEWNEELHPRDPHGRFTSGGGSEQHFYEPEASSRGGAKSWGELSSRDQRRVESQWREANWEKEVTYREREFHHSGEALDQAKELVREWWNDQSGDDTTWGEDAVAEALVSYKEESGKEIPYTGEQLRNAIELTGHTARGHLEVKFDDTKLQEPADIAYSKGQLDLPGIEHPDPSGHLTPDMREHLTKEITEAFNNRADEVEPGIQSPDYGEEISETLDEVWSSMDDDEKFEWAKTHTSIVESEKEEPPPAVGLAHPKPPMPSAEFIAHLKDVVKDAADPRIVNDIKFDTTTVAIPTQYGPIAPLAATSRNDGKITFYVRNNQKQSDAEIIGTTVHESMHRKFDDVSKVMGQEDTALEQRYGPTQYGKYLKQGKLPKSEEMNFPISSRMIKFQSNDAKTKMIDEIHDHPVSPYANQYWAIASRDPSGGAIFTAIHETLAEIARRDRQEGKVPEGIPTWKEMYTTVNDIWEETHARTAKS